MNNERGRVPIIQSGLFSLQVAADFHRLGFDGKNEKIISTNVRGPLEALYRPPLLNHLLETGQWTAVSERLDDIFAELEAKWTWSQEYGHEVYCVLHSSFYYYAHKNGEQLSELVGVNSGRTADDSLALQLGALRKWAYEVVRQLKASSKDEARNSRLKLVDKIHRYIQSNLDQDISLQLLTDHLGLHPAYISKIYKLETGIGISEYIVNYRMELASRLLKENDDKIYEIAARLGYLTTHYFIKLFKKHFGMTPQEYRERAST
ncbi:helix-turn-helix transcriptional regulator [Paenibacillus sp. YIM B09110]|uniref:helix-turn-helix transcriptional regulator n=1 Tax=Paenibacillus sp. YIM B09110 TaxID=3126102 RepID=UPI00301DD9D2